MLGVGRRRERCRGAAPSSCPRLTAVTTAAAARIAPPTAYHPRRAGRWVRAWIVVEPVRRLDVRHRVGEQVAQVVVGHDASPFRSSRSAAAPREAWLLTAPRLMPRVLGDLGLGEVQVVAQRQHLALALWQRPHRLEHRGSAVDDLGRFVRVGYRLGSACRVARHHHPVPERGPGLVDHRLAQVGQRLVRVAQPTPASVHGDERVLHHLFRGADVADEQHREPHQLPPVRGVQLLQRLVGGPGALGHQAVRCGRMGGHASRTPGTRLRFTHGRLSLLQDRRR